MPVHHDMPTRSNVGQDLWWLLENLENFSGPILLVQSLPGHFLEDAVVDDAGYTTVWN